MKVINIIVIIIMLLSCTEKAEVIGGIYQENYIDLSLKDSNGFDLLNPETPNAIDKEKIKVLYLTNEGVMPIYSSSQTQKDAVFFVYEQDSEYRLRVFLNTVALGDYATTYINWKDNDVDTLRALYNKNKNLLTLKSLWINDSLSFPNGDSTGNNIILIK